MLPKTSRCTGESSCHCKTVAMMPEATVISANPTPIATTIWLGLMRRVIGVAGVLSGLLTRPNLPNAARPGGIARGESACGYPLVT
jgi:hypothetical protein